MPGRTSSVTVLASRKPSRARKPTPGTRSSLSRKKKLGGAFICTQGVVYIDQPEAGCLAVEEAVARIADGGRAAPFALAALSVMTTLTGSVLIALAVAHGEVTLTEAWRAAHVDEGFEMRAWGEDVEAFRRRARKWREMEAAAGLFQLVHDSDA
jgi:chaperone required for assembly of F1-ATPase